MISIFCSLPVPRSLAETLMIPFASMSNATSICGTPRGAGGMPTRSNLPSVLLYSAISDSPCSTCTCTDGWLSSAVEKTSDLRVGMVVLRSISFVSTPPRVSMPRLSGVTSSSSTSLTSPFSTPPWMAAPTATTSSGLTPLCGSLPISSLTFACTAGIRVMPPTSTTCSMSAALRPASASACFVGPTVRSSRSCASSSSFARVSCRSRCFGPSCVAVMNGRLICVVIVDDSSIFAFSPASYRRWSAIGSMPRSMPWSRLNSATIQSTIALSKLSPPRWLSPFVDFTSKTPSPSSSTDTSNVPPPRSKTRIVWSAPSLSSP